MRHHVLLFLALALGATLAGCFGSDDGASADATDATTRPGSFDETTGAITGIVADSELTPLADVQLQLLETDFTATSGADGTFSFSNIPPGEYTLAAAKLGYASVAQRVTVKAGEGVSDVRLLLEPVAAKESRIVVTEFRGFITCSIGAAGVISEECGQGLQTPVGTFGRDPNNNIDWITKIENKTDVEEIANIYYEMTWRPGSAAANQLGFHVAHGFTCIPSCGEKLPYCEVWDNHGPPVLKCDITAETLGIKDPDKDLPWDITARAWAAPVEPTEIPNIVLQQPVQMYRSEFHGDAKPEGYSAIPDA